MLRDVSIMDVSSFRLASINLDVSGENVNEGIIYTLRSKKPVKRELWRTYAIAATINVGWCASNSKTEWVRKGDYLTTTQQSIKLTSDNNDYVKHVEVECYCK